MNKLLLSLGVVALLATPAAAGRLDVDQSVLQPSAETGIDYSGTRAIQPVERAAPATADSQQGAQGSVFGANSR